jgi:pimeloyl-ACP methyl ester carboxylesterase
MIRHQFKTHDDVTLNAVETGNPLGQAILFVHGLSQRWRNSRILSYANDSVSSLWICAGTASRKVLSAPSIRRAIRWRRLPVVIGWSAGAWSVQSYFFVHSTRRHR